MSLIGCAGFALVVLGMLLVAYEVMSRPPEPITASSRLRPDLQQELQAKYDAIWRR